jgi:hypothetical protein
MPGPVGRKSTGGSPRARSVAGEALSQTAGRKSGRESSILSGVSSAMKPGRQPIRSLEAMPQKSATEVKNGWAKVVREVRSSGSVAVTQHDRVEMVVMDAETYREITSLAVDQAERRRAMLDELTQAFDQRLRSLDKRETPKRFAAVRAAKGRLKHPPKAGSTF